MKRNIGGIERIVRVVVGAIIISLAFWGLKTPWAYLGIIPIVTIFKKTLSGTINALNTQPY
jgi:hypothetical protein